MGRDRDRVSRAVGQSPDLLAVKLDVTSRDDAQAAVRAAVDRFGRIDVLVNNAASFYAGYTRAVLPLMRRQRSGTSSRSPPRRASSASSSVPPTRRRSSAWRTSLHAEVAPFGIATTVVNPGFFRTELLTEQSTDYAEPTIAGRAKQLEFWKAQNGRQSGDPAKLARALIMIASQEPPPRRFIAGADAVATAEQTAADLKAQTDARWDLSSSLAFD